MGRLKVLREDLEERLKGMPKIHNYNSALIHLYGVSLAATLLAEKRDMNTELSAMAGMLHDIAAYMTGSYQDHAHKGAAMAKDILAELQLTDEDETEIICNAIYHHDDKEVIDEAYDELLKDADVIHHIFNDLDKPIQDKEKVRYHALCVELGLMDRLI